MAHSPGQSDGMPITSNLKDFDTASGTRTERLIFNHRRLLIAICILLTLGLGFLSARLQVKASFEDMMPQSHPFVKNYLEHASSLRSLGNSVRIVVTNRDGDIYDPAYLQTLREINDKVYLYPGVDRAFVKSLWMPVVRWNEITADGFQGGPVMPIGFDGSAASVEALRFNVRRSGITGSLVGNDQKSSMIFLPLIDKDAVTGEAFDYKAFRDQIETLRGDFKQRGVDIQVIGFAQLIGDLIDGLNQVLVYFLIAAVTATLFILFYTRCWRSTLLVTGCSIVAVVWQMGLMQAFGFVLDPYSILVPFLIFAIGVSHGAQKMNGVMQDIGRGTHKYIAARFTFRRLFLAGMTALLADAVGFAVLAVIDIPVIRGLAAAASIGVAVLIFTNLILLPVLLSFTGVSAASAARSQRRLEGTHPLLVWLSRFADKRRAVWVIVATVVLTAGGWMVALNIKIGDLDPGAPELRADSTYNKDNAYISGHYQLSSDQFAVIVATPPQGLINYETLLEMDRLEQVLRDLPGVQTTVSAATLARAYTKVGFEGSLKWESINRDPFVLQDAMNLVSATSPEMFNDARSVAPIIAFLSDHKAETLTRVVTAVEAFAKAHNTDERQFLLAAGTSGIDAATNIAVEHANRTMLLYVYAAVILLCFITFRSWRAVIVAVVPLVVTTILCEALMVMLGIGVKVATLPVTALGVGIGVDYSLYLLTIHLYHQRQGASIREAYLAALSSTGKVVALIGVTLSAGVITWAWSPIKFQADMGILLAFMFLWNMLGALILVPSLAAFLLPQSPMTRQGGQTDQTDVLKTQARRPPPMPAQAARKPPGVRAG
ncbi:MMPL family transporter [Pseudomonas sp. Bout1]|uniref:efflux RND transporter permease subunit n=1 Tax=Pseudomonas sp. Bout1 TaxID=3048600 RepID=UPI002AB4CFE9|nr:MMPL family transporter [Pseudomonas sp. Bout1]MDY7533072.1 MMPL family transporter [Pseudomonas sp. Bout1]MEB0184447.1 MMPL family transporter [Pseudomonas sp. Bout1]